MRPIIDDFCAYGPGLTRFEAQGIASLHRGRVYFGCLVLEQLKVKEVDMHRYGMVINAPFCGYEEETTLCLMKRAKELGVGAVSPLFPISELLSWHIGSVRRQLEAIRRSGDGMENVLMITAKQGEDSLEACFRLAQEAGFKCLCLGTGTPNDALSPSFVDTLERWKHVFSLSVALDNEDSAITDKIKKAGYSVRLCSTVMDVHGYGRL
jgi:hypothetical protein